MKTIELSLELPTDYTPDFLKRQISREIGSQDFAFSIIKKSLDARNKSNIHWLVRLSVVSPPSPSQALDRPQLIIAKTGRRKKAVVVGSGPAGFFAALVLNLAGFSVTILERGPNVEQRTLEIKAFEQSGTFSPRGNYAFGEGGAGTFSDGKLTSRTKGISLERQFVLDAYIRAGAPEEIAYLTHPHVGSDNLRTVVRHLRNRFESLGGAVHFDTFLTGLTISSGTVISAQTENGSFEADEFFLAPGHSAFETYRMLIRCGVVFRPKNFALGCRVEHPQALINYAQWGKDRLPGVKAAEYRLTSAGDGNAPVYTFCMCPGGVVVPATAYGAQNIVNGMSQYARDGKFANSACVAGVNQSTMKNTGQDAGAVLDWLESLESSFYNYSGSYRAPSCTITEFLKGSSPSTPNPSSHPLGLTPAPLWDLLPSPVCATLRKGLKDFSRKLRGFDQGILLGLESKTSAPIQVAREKDYRCTGFSNLRIVGEGSGYAGGIISSAVDGIKAALALASSI